MTDRELVLRLIELGVNTRRENPAGFADPSRDAAVNQLGVAVVASWLTALGQLRLVGNVQPRFGAGTGTLVYQVTEEAMTLWSNQQALARHLITILPEEAPTYDVFISYGHLDAHIANELRTALVDKKLTCFMAEKDLQIAAEWQGQIKDALRGSRTILVLLTPRSFDRPWVLLETGAAWALGIPLIPALIQLSPDQLIDPIRRYQARVVETGEQIRLLAVELKNRINP